MKDYSPTFTTVSSVTYSGTTSGVVIVKAAAVAGAWTLTLPAAVPAVTGYPLTATTGGVGSWALLTVPAGGTGLSTYDTGELLVGNVSGTLTRLGIGTVGQVLTVSGGTAAWAAGTGATFANPSASVGLTAVNGAASTAMRSDGAPALSVSIVPTWTGIHIHANEVDLSHALNVPYLYLNSTSGTYPVYQRFDIAGAAKAYLGIAGATNDLVTGAVLGDLVIRDTANVLVSANNGTSIHLKVANSGQLSILAGSSTTRGVIGSNVHVNFSDMATSGSGETDMGTYSYPANAFSTNGDCAIIDAFGTTSSGVGTATLKFYIGGTSRIAILGLTATESPWRFQCRVTRKTSTQIGYVVSGTVGLVATVASATIAVSDLTANALDVKVTGQLGTSQTATEYGFICDFISRGS